MFSLLSRLPQLSLKRQAEHMSTYPLRAAQQQDPPIFLSHQPPLSQSLFSRLSDFYSQCSLFVFPSCMFDLSNPVLYSFFASSLSSTLRGIYRKLSPFSISCCRAPGKKNEESKRLRLYSAGGGKSVLIWLSCLFGMCCFSQDQSRRIHSLYETHSSKSYNKYVICFCGFFWPVNRLLPLKGIWNLKKQA